MSFSQVLLIGGIAFMTVVLMIGRRAPRIFVEGGVGLVMISFGMLTAQSVRPGAISTATQLAFAALGVYLLGGAVARYFRQGGIEPRKQ